MFALEQARDDVARKRRRWRSWQGRLDPRRLVFIDETWIKTNMAPLRGWGPKGKRLRGFAPHGHWRTLTFLGALRHDRLTAPCVFDGPINGRSFLAYVRELLVPTLRPRDIGQVQACGGGHENTSFHRFAGSQNIPEPSARRIGTAISASFAPTLHPARVTLHAVVIDSYPLVTPEFHDFGLEAAGRV